PVAQTQEAVVATKKPTGPPPKPKSELAKRLEKLDKIPISILAEKLGLSNIKVEGILIKLIDNGELDGTIKKGIFYRKK
ncbi:MAG: PCI domain-containing protein, partial [Candidatus Helarchaeota archaeon]|nr:PCI domain-containing protein [Candidatus Helarchaeota archaeon]